MKFMMIVDGFRPDRNIYVNLEEIAVLTPDIDHGGYLANCASGATLLILSDDMDRIFPLLGLEREAAKGGAKRKKQ